MFTSLSLQLEANYHWLFQSVVEDEEHLKRCVSLTETCSDEIGCKTAAGPFSFLLFLKLLLIFTGRWLE